MGAKSMMMGCAPLLAFCHKTGFQPWKSLYFSDSGVTDVGAVALANALSNATRTFLTHLSLTAMKIGDKGIVALASLVEQDRFK
jgi:hypothetical protein